MRYEYKFVRLDETTPKAFGLVHAATYQEPAVYQRAVHEHAAQGWRLVQLFVPAGMAAYYELVFEREVAPA